MPWMRKLDDLHAAACLISTAASSSKSAFDVPLDPHDDAESLIVADYGLLLNGE